MLSLRPGCPGSLVTRFGVGVLKYNSTLPAAQRLTASRVMSLQSGLCVVSYKRNARIRVQQVHIHFNHLTRVFVSRLRNSRYFNLPKLVSALNVLKHANRLIIRNPGRIRACLHPIVSLFYQNVRFRIHFGPISAHDRSLIVRSHSLSICSVPLGRQVPAYNCLFTRGPGRTRVVHRVASFCRIPIHYVGSVGRKRSCIAPRNRIIPGSHLAHPTAPPGHCTFYSSATCGHSVVPVVRKTSLLCRRTAFTRYSLTHTGRAFRSATHRTTRVTHSTRIGHLIVNRCSTHCRSLSRLRQRTRTMFPNAVLKGRKAIVPIWSGGEYHEGIYQGVR